MQTSNKPPNSDSPLTEKIRFALARDPKRTGLLGGLVLLMAILWGRLLLNGPASATASLIRRSVAAITDAQQPAERTPLSNPVMDWLGEPRRPVDRNLFAIKLDYFARAGDRTGSDNTGLGSSADAGADSGTSSGNADADAAHQQQILQENLQTQAAQLKLQTTMMGASPRAMVNGELVKEGDLVAGFTVVRIEARKIVVQQDGVVLEVAMP